MNFTDYAEQALQRLPNTKSAYLYKQEVIAKMTARANELIKSGLSDNNVINEIIINEYEVLGFTVCGCRYTYGHSQK